MILGPSKWRRGFNPELPGWLNGELPTLWKRRGAKMLWPVDIRAAMAGSLHRQKHHATLMEGNERRRNEANISFFKRIVHEQEIAQFFVYWPFGAQRAGLDVEFGHLLSQRELRYRLHEDESPDIRLFVEARAGSVVGGRFESNEMGRRTTYYEDFVTLRCPIVEWETYDALWDAIQHHADAG